MSGRVDTSPAAVAERVNYWSHLFTADYPTRWALADACDLIHALAVERDRLAAEWAAERDGRKAERLASLEEIVREYGMNVDDELVDSCANSTVYRAMLDLADAGRMTIEPGGVGRRIYGRWVAS